MYGPFLLDDYDYGVQFFSETHFHCALFSNIENTLLGKNSENLEMERFLPTCIHSRWPFQPRLLILF